MTDDGDFIKSALEYPGFSHLRGEPPIEIAKQLALYGLQIDGGHHKQWILEQILLTLGVPSSEIRETESDWGIIP
jgi:hypothetical protein